MTREEIFAFMNANPACFLATVENDQPRVRGVLLYKASEEGIIFHTGKMKSLYNQLQASPKAEFCFVKDGVQLRVAGELKLIEDKNLKIEISNHPSRAFMKSFGDNFNLDQLAVYKMTNGKATYWTLKRNFEPTLYAELV